MFINFRDIPGHQNLFLDFLYEFDNVKDFYDKNFRDVDKFEGYFSAFNEFNAGKQFKIGNYIAKQYKDFSASDLTQSNIDALSFNNTLAVVTGQQLGLLGGPLYTIYKIITAIKLAEKYNDKYANFNFVPVFWLEGDDHDFAEVSYVNIINKLGELATITYNDGLDAEINRGSVGNIVFNENIKAFINEFIENLRDSEFIPAIKSQIEELYKPGATYKQAFKQLIFNLFDKYGLVIFDPQDPEVKKLLVPIFQNEISDFRHNTNILVERSARLEEVYHAQVKVKPINLFYSLDGGRYLIEPGENEFKLKGKRKKFTYEELMKTIQNEPENFSPNVLLRPVCQDYLLPTAFYVGGPGEIAYSAQVNPLYEIYKVPSPILYPRGSATLFEKNVPAFLERYNINVNEMFIVPEELKLKVLNSIADIKLDALYEKSVEEIDLIFDRIKESLFSIDKTISDAGEKYRQKTLSGLNEFKLKAIDAQKRKYDVVLKQFEKVSTSIMPDGILQERVFSLFYYLGKYGDDFMSMLYKELEIEEFEHQIITL
ncbi:MAG: bacillithiol biosynthesis cysteine-adding enzyme BshC [Bacteroidota bacterium]|nr:bacillithiol biosynthesis cysteine-adding enzyme BshC [Bacteroidota bacterium]